MSEERCFNCDELTGNAGAMDDSIIVEGEPYCEGCRNGMWVCDECELIIKGPDVTYEEKHDGCGGNCT